jgi:hypothetical protein
MMSSVKAGQKVLRAVAAGQETLAKVQSAKNLAIRAATQFVKEKTGLDRLKGMAETLLPMLGCPQI